jgi:hypothetical protein
MATTIAKAKAAKPQPSSHSHAERQAATAMRPDHQPCHDVFFWEVKNTSMHDLAKQPHPCIQLQAATAMQPKPSSHSHHNSQSHSHSDSKTYKTTTEMETLRENFSGAPEYGIKMKKLMPLKQ